MPLAQQGHQTQADLIFLVDDGATDVRHDGAGDARDDLGCPHPRDYRFVTSGFHRSSIRSEGTFGSAPPADSRYARQTLSVLYTEMKVFLAAFAALAIAAC